MWDRNYFSHSIPNPPGGNVFDELHRRGICYTLAGENIGINNYPDDVATQTIFNGWMSSSGHRALILGSGFNRVGIGAFKGTGSTYPDHLWTAVFIHTCGSATPTPAPTPTKTPAPTKTPGPTPTATPRPSPTPTPRPTATPRATATPHPTATPKPTPRPTSGTTTTPTPNVTPEPTPEVTPPVTPDPQVAPGTADVLVGGAVIGMWVDKATDATFDGTGWPDWPLPAPTEPPAAATDGPPGETGPPVVDGLVTDTDGGSLRVVEPQSNMGLLDTIVGGVLAGFLGS
jgi:hypothetical protein